MTLQQIGQLRDKYFQALMDLDPSKITYTVDGETVQHDQHRESLQKMWEYYDKLYTSKSWGGKTYRLNMKAL